MRSCKAELKPGFACTQNHKDFLKLSFDFVDTALILQKQPVRITGFSIGFKKSNKFQTCTHTGL
jgi:hypothetical protein